MTGFWLWFRKCQDAVENPHPLIVDGFNLGEKVMGFGEVKR